MFTLTWSDTLGFPPSRRNFSTTGSLFSIAAVRNSCSSTVSGWKEKEHVLNNHHLSDRSRDRLNSLSLRFFSLHCVKTFVLAEHAIIYIIYHIFNVINVTTVSGSGCCFLRTGVFLSLLLFLSCRMLNRSSTVSSFSRPLLSV